MYLHVLHFISTHFMIQLYYTDDAQDDHELQLSCDRPRVKFPSLQCLDAIVFSSFLAWIALLRILDWSSET